jgi:hypothetical protein
MSPKLGPEGPADLQDLLVCRQTIPEQVEVALLRRLQVPESVSVLRFENHRDLSEALEALSERQLLPDDGRPVADDRE